MHLLFNNRTGNMGDKVFFFNFFFLPLVILVLELDWILCLSAGINRICEIGFLFLSTIIDLV
jgi:hypothetical protein